MAEINPQHSAIFTGSSLDIEEPRTKSSQHIHKGIGLWVAGLFLLGAMAGAGIVAMPNAFLKASWWTVLMVTVMSAVSCFTGFQLSWSWTILQETWPEYAKQTRNPYPEIGYRAGGMAFKYFIQGCVNISMFGASVAFLILSAQNISHLLHDWFNFNINYCYMVLIIAACLLPILFLGTPKDFWPIAVGAIGATGLAIIFIMVGTLFDMPQCQNKVHYPTATFGGIVSAYCTIVFAYGGHATFPTIQHDMKQPNKFPLAVLFAFFALFVLYFPMPVLAYFVYGHTVHGTIDLNLSSKWVRDAIMVLITGHILFAFFIVMSPVTQDLERVVGIPLHFTWKRVCTRTFMLSFATFLALSLPDFNVLLEIVGGTTIAATAFLCPGPFYLMLRTKHGSSIQNKPRTANSDVEIRTIPKFFSHVSSNGRKISTCEILLNVIVVGMGLCGAVATVYQAVLNWKAMATSCYFTGMHLVSKHQNLHIDQCWSDNFGNDTQHFLSLSENFTNFV